MATIKTKVELNEKDLKQVLAEKYNLREDSVSISINHYKGDQREPEYTSIIVEGIQKSN